MGMRGRGGVLRGHFDNDQAIVGKGHCDCRRRGVFRVFVAKEKCVFRVEE